MFDRKQVIAKIQAMLKLQQETSFEGEAAAASKLIDKLCKEYGVSIEQATETIVEDEVLRNYKRADHAYNQIVNAVANYYDAKAYLHRTAEDRSVRIIGSQAQQIQVQLYSEYLLEVMEREAEIAYNAEKIIGDLHDRKVDRSFKINFRKAFALKIAERLREMKEQENRVHEDKQAVEKAMSTMRFYRGGNHTGPKGSGAAAGNSVGGEVSLNRQASGAQQKYLVGA
jgi:hypothetical protein